MALGKSITLPIVTTRAAEFCEEQLSETSVYRLLHREGGRLFPDEMFEDLFHTRGRRSVPPRVVAAVMVLQRLEGLSDREAVDRFTFDLRWKYAAGGLSGEYPGFVHTVLVGMRARLRESERPNRIFEAVLDIAKQAGLVGRKRVLDSTPLYDAVATQDTVTLIRSAIRGVLRVVEESLAAEIRAVLRRDDDYVAPGKPTCDWDDAVAREVLVDALARDGYAVVALLDGRTLHGEVKTAAELLATVLGQDLEETDDGLFRIARRVAPDRVISTVDPEARHGHKTSARGFDGYKGHIAIDPDSEIITQVDVTAGNVGDAVPAEALLADVLPPVTDVTPASEPESCRAPEGAHLDDTLPSEPTAVYGDASYGTASLVERLEAAGIEANVKVQPPSGRDGRYSQDEFDIDVEGGTVRCPHEVVVPLSKPRKGGHRIADFGDHCAACPLRQQCTESKTGRRINVHPKHETLTRARTRQRDARWRRDYRATRPKVERKFGHLMRRKHGGRRARVRGRTRILGDFSVLAAACNLQRLAALQIKSDGGKWRIQ